MLCLFDTGTISLKENVLTWNISNFFSLPIDVGSEIRTPEFLYGGTRYTLAIWPRGLKGVEKEWFGVCLYSKGTSKQRGFIKFSIMAGNRVLKSCTIECSEYGNYKDDRFMEWSDFSVLRRQIAPNGCLTIECSLFCEKNYGLEDYELDDSIASVSPYDSICDYSFLTSTCMIPSSHFNSAASRQRKTPLAPEAKPRASSETTNSIFSASSDAYCVPTYAHAEPSECDSPAGCKIAGTAALDCNRERKRNATELPVADTGGKAGFTPGEDGQISTPKSNAESKENETGSCQTRSALSQPIASKSNIVPSKETVPCRRVSANSTSQHQSTSKSDREVSLTNFNRDCSETAAKIWNESPASSVRKIETNTADFGTPRMSDTQETRTSAIAKGESRIPAHVLYSSVGNANLTHLGKAFTAEVYNYKGLQNGQNFELRLENCPRTCSWNSKCLKSNNGTLSSASKVNPSSKCLTTRVETAEDIVKRLRLPNYPSSISAIPTASGVESSNSESSIAQSVAHNAAEEDPPATAVDTGVNHFAGDIPSSAIPCSNSPPSRPAVAQPGEETLLGTGDSEVEIGEGSGTENTNDPTVSSSDDYPSSLAIEAQFCRKLQSFENLSQALRRYYLESEEYDLTIKIKDHNFRAHRGFLKMRSPVFAQLLSENAGETLEIPELVCDPCAFHNFLLFVYDGQLSSVTEANVCDLYRAAQFFRFPELGAHCVEFMRDSLSVRIIWDVLKVAKQHNEAELLELATSFFARNVKDILVTEEFYKFLK